MEITARLMESRSRVESAWNEGNAYGSTSRLSIEALAALQLAAPSTPAPRRTTKRRNRSAPVPLISFAGIALANLTTASARNSASPQRTATRSSISLTTTTTLPVNSLASTNSPLLNFPSATAPPINSPRERPRIRKREHLEQVPTRYVLVEGELLPGEKWELFGKQSAAAKHFVDVIAVDPPRMEQNLDDSAAFSATGQNSASSTTDPLPSATITVPDGWATTPRPTTFYAVPVIVASSLILAIFIAGGMLAGLVWRSKQRIRRHVEAGDEVLEEKWSKLDRLLGRRKYKPKKRRIVQREMVQEGGDAVSVLSVRSVTEFAVGGGGRVRQRRARRRRPTNGTDDSQNMDGDETAPLTGSTTSRPATPTIAARLAARLRPSTADSTDSSDPPRLNPSTVFSRDLNSGPTTSTDESGSADSHSVPHSSAETPNSPPLLSISTASPVIPAPDIIPPSPTGQSNFGLIFPVETLPQPSPPAYRPNKIVPSTSRLNPLTLPPAAIPLTTGESSEWSDEKVEERPIEPEAELETPAEEAAEEAEVEELIDPATYSAHIATDDKTVLARLRATSTLPPSRTSPLETPSAPQLDGNDVDEDGFERLVLPESIGSTSSAPILPNLIPPPPTPLSPSFDYSSSSPISATVSSTAKGKEAARDGEDEVLDLPIYRNGIDPMAAASAPPPEDHDDFEAEDEEEANRNRGGVV